MENKPNNLLDVYELYIEHLNSHYSGKRCKTYVQEIGYTFTSNVLIGLGYPHIPSGTKSTLAEIEASRLFMKSQNLNKLVKLRIAQREGFRLVYRSHKMQEIYQRSLEKFLAWCENQSWWPEERSFQYSPSSQQFCCPTLQSEYGSKANKTLTHRQGKHIIYKLQPNEKSPNLKAELNEFYQFLTQPEHPERIGNGIKDSCADNYLRTILLIFGWFYRFEEVSLDKLSLSLLIPKVCKEDLRKLSEREQRKLWNKHRKYLELWLNRYWTFLRESMQSTSPRTRNGKLNGLAALGRFQYRTEVEVLSDYQNIPILQVIENHHKENSRKVTDWNVNKRFVSNQEQKWPDVKEGQTALSAVRQNILEPLRLECWPKYKGNKPRGGSAIAKSAQRFLAWFFLAGLPARRQEEYRDLKLALSCPVQRPPFSELPEKGVYHPLPPSTMRDQRHDGTIKDNYIYKTYVHNGKFYESGLWVLDIQEYKKVDKYGPQLIMIKNRLFNDGTYLYDYFEHYLYGWWLPGGRKKQQIYDWWDQNLKGRRGRWISMGRAELEPCDACYINHDEQYGFGAWGYFFVRPLSGQRNKANQFEDLVETAAHHYTGKQISPHTMRSVWATWAYQVGLTDQQKSSLAYAMGHGLRTLRALYERSSPDEKRRPIEEAIDQLFFMQQVSSQSGLDSTSSSSLEHRLLALPKDKQEELIAILAQKGMNLN